MTDVPHHLFQITPHVVRVAAAAGIDVSRRLQANNVDPPGMLVVAASLICAYARMKNVPVESVVSCLPDFVREMEEIHAMGKAAADKARS